MPRKNPRSCVTCRCGAIRIKNSPTAYRVQHRPDGLVAGVFCGGAGAIDAGAGQLLCRVAGHRWGGLFLGGFLLLDLGRANLPYIIHWDYKQKYEVGSLNPIEEFLRNKPYEHRVAGLPFRAPQGLELMDQVYRIEWMQQHFPYYNIQCLDIIQMPRMPEDLKSYLTALSPHAVNDAPSMRVTGS